MIGYTNERKELAAEVQALLNGSFREKPIEGLTDGVNIDVAAVPAMFALNASPDQAENGSRRLRVDIAKVLQAASDVENFMESGVRVTYGGSK